MTLGHPFQSDSDSTPLTDDEKLGLIPSWVSLRHELNQVEATNITKAVIWARKSRRDILTESFIRLLHHKVFGEVWLWAGKYRTSARNIDIESWQIQTEIKTLLDDVVYWIGHKTYQPDEISARFHHRLVYIHPFPNGNGRHSRLMADLLAVIRGLEPYTWGRGNIVDPGETRRAYIDALQAADRHDIAPLVAFIRS